MTTRKTIERVCFSCPAAELWFYRTKVRVASSPVYGIIHLMRKSAKLAQIFYPQSASPSTRTNVRAEPLEQEQSRTNVREQIDAGADRDISPIY